LKDANLVYVEHNFFVDAPFPVVGRPDQVYRLSDGRHVPLENKNRNSYRVYDGDVAQLSLQAWLLRELGKPTADFGLLAINHRQSGKRQAVRVPLWNDAACEQLIARYLALKEGKVLPRKSSGPKCTSCGHRTLCQ
jgi:CRISPR/Cas system-associated exonuclease Cas4 (RecB family)